MRGRGVVRRRPVGRSAARPAGRGRASRWVFDSAPLTAPLEILGSPARRSCAWASDQPLAMVSIRVNEVRADGSVAAGDPRAAEPQPTAAPTPSPSPSCRAGVRRHRDARLHRPPLRARLSRCPLCSALLLAAGLALAGARDATVAWGDGAALVLPVRACARTATARPATRPARRARAVRDADAGQRHRQPLDLARPHQRPRRAALRLGPRRPPAAGAQRPDDGGGRHRPLRHRGERPPVGRGGGRGAVRAGPRRRLADQRPRLGPHDPAPATPSSSPPRSTATRAPAGSGRAPGRSRSRGITGRRWEPVRASISGPPRSLAPPRPRGVRGRGRAG